jgi:ATP-dependent DNA helicase RecQ
MSKLFFGQELPDEKYWMALLRQVLVAGYLTKDIETYGN